MKIGRARWKVSMASSRMVVVVLVMMFAGFPVSSSLLLELGIFPPPFVHSSGDFSVWSWIPLPPILLLFEGNSAAMD